MTEGGRATPTAPRAWRVTAALATHKPLIPPVNEGTYGCHMPSTVLSVACANPAEHSVHVNTDPQHHEQQVHTGTRPAHAQCNPSGARYSADLGKRPR